MSLWYEHVCVCACVRACVGVGEQIGKVAVFVHGVCMRG